jgi:hypothetical protein
MKTSAMKTPAANPARITSRLAIKCDGNTVTKARRVGASCARATVRAANIAGCKACFGGSIRRKTAYGQGMEGVRAAQAIF